MIMDYKYLLLIATVFRLTTFECEAQRHRHGARMGHGGGGMGRGMMGGSKGGRGMMAGGGGMGGIASPRFLFAHHDTITRTVTPIPDGTGYVAVTTSTDPDVARGLQLHVVRMMQRAKSGGKMRWWDPAFEQFYDHIDHIHTTINNTPDGVQVTVMGDNPAAAATACNHANAVSAFASNGFNEMHVTHPVTQAPWQCRIQN